MVEQVHVLKKGGPLKPVAIITPTSVMIPSVNRALWTAQTPMLNVWVETFPRHVLRRTQSERLRRGQPLLDDQEASLFIDAIIASDELSYFNNARQFNQYTTLFHQTVSDLRLGLPPNSVSTALDTLGQKGKEIGRIYRKYLMAKGRRLDYADMLALYASGDESLILFPGVEERLTWAESAAISRNPDNRRNVDYQSCSQSAEIKLRQAPCPTLEIRNMFREIIQLGAPCDCVAIIAPNEYLPLVSQEAQRIGIRLHCPSGEKTAVQQAYIFTRLLEIVESDDDYTLLKRYFQSRRDFQSLDLLQEHYTDGGYHQLMQKLARLSQTSESASISKFKQIIEDIVHIRALRDSPHEIGRLIMDRFLSKSNEKQVLRSVLETLARQLPDISFQAWKTLVAERLETVRRVRTAPRNAILVTNETEIGAFDYLFCLGLHQKHLFFNPREDPILTDHCRQTLNAVSGGGLLTSRELNQKFLGKFKSITGGARIIWFGSSSRTDPVTLGQTSPPLGLFRLGKAMVNQVSDLWEDSPIGASNPHAFLPEVPEQSLDSYEWCLYHLYNQTPGFINHCLAKSPSAQNNYYRLKTQFSSSFDEYSGLVAMDGRKKPGKACCFSIPELQGFMTCPFRWFLDKRLDLKPLHEPPPADALTSEMFNRILEQTLKTCLQNRNLARNKPVEMVLDEIIHRTIETETRMAPLALEKLKHDLNLMTLNFFKHLDQALRGPRKPRLLDLRFGNQSQTDIAQNPVSVCIGGCTFTLRGLIHRIDIADDTAFIIDYQAAKAPSRQAREQHQAMRLQACLHAEVLNSLMRTLLIEMGARIKTIYTGGLPLKDNADEFLFPYDDQAQASLKDAIVFIFKAMYNGWFPPTGRCTDCDYTMICGPDIVQTSYQKFKKGFKNKTLSQLLETYQRIEGAFHAY